MCIKTHTLSLCLSRSVSLSPSLLSSLPLSLFPLLSPSLLSSPFLSPSLSLSFSLSPLLSPSLSLSFSLSLSEIHGQKPVVIHASKISPHQFEIKCNQGNPPHTYMYPTRLIHPSPHPPPTQPSQVTTSHLPSHRRPASVRHLPLSQPRPNIGHQCNYQVQVHCMCREH